MAVSMLLSLAFLPATSLLWPPPEREISLPSVPPVHSSLFHPQTAPPPPSSASVTKSTFWKRNLSNVSTIKPLRCIGGRSWLRMAPSLALSAAPAVRRARGCVSSKTTCAAAVGRAFISPGSVAGEVACSQACSFCSRMIVSAPSPPSTSAKDVVETEKGTVEEDRMEVDEQQSVLAPVRFHVPFLSLDCPDS